MSDDRKKLGTALPPRPTRRPEAPPVNADPNDPEVARFLSGNKVDRAGEGNLIGEAPSGPLLRAEARPSVAEVKVKPEIRVDPKFSMTPDEKDHIDKVRRRFVVATNGDECSLSRIVIAAVRLLDTLDDSRLVAAVRKVPAVKKGRVPGT